jgi:hypothetical protein
VMTMDPERRAKRVAELINAFSPTALAFSAIVVATGAISAWLPVGTVAVLWQSNYGRVLMIKLVVVAMVGNSRCLQLAAGKAFTGYGRRVDSAPSFRQNRALDRSSRNCCNRRSRRDANSHASVGVYPAHS